MAETKLFLYTGKGGVGKTTVSCSTAVDFSNKKIKTILVSSDPAHSTDDVLGVKVGSEPTKIKDNLWEIALRQGHWIGGTASLVPIPYDYFHYNMAMDNTSISLIQDKYGDWREIIYATNSKMSQLAKKLGKIGEHTDGSIAWMEHVQEFIDEIKGE